MLLFVLAWQRGRKIVFREWGRGAWQRYEESRACRQRGVHGINLILQVWVNILFTVPVVYQ